MRLQDIKASRNPLYKLINDEDYTHSMSIMITGPKRSGKSLLQSRLQTADRLKGRRVRTTMPSHTPSYFIKKGLPYVETEDIDWDKLYMLDPEYDNCVVGFDEGVNIDDRRISGSNKNKIVNAFMNQIGHRSVTVYTTVKVQRWMDSRFIFECDLEIKCQDVALSQWGKRAGLRRGRIIRLDFYDHSGSTTGRPYNIKYNWRPFRTIIWKDAWHWWDGYDTRQVVGLEEMRTPIRFDLKERVISNREQINSEMQGAIRNLALEFKSRGNESVSCDTFWGAARECGIEGDPRALGKYIKPLRIKRIEKRGGNIYDLSDMV